MSQQIELSLPDALLDSVTRRAASSGRPVHAQLLHDIEATDVREREEQVLIEEIRAGRESLANRGVRISDEFLAEAKAWGRK